MTTNQGDTNVGYRVDFYGDDAEITMDGPSVEIYLHSSEVVRQYGEAVEMAEYQLRRRGGFCSSVIRLSDGVTVYNYNPVHSDNDFCE